MNTDTFSRPFSQRRIRTRERILDDALRLLNLHGERHVTIVSILAEMKMSPGSMYYHFRSKAEIIYGLLNRCEHAVRQHISQLDGGAGQNDYQAKLVGLLRTTWEYRFIFRDLHDLFSRYEDFKHYYERFHRAVLGYLQQFLGSCGKSMQVHQVETLSTNVVMLLTYWLSFEHVSDPRTIDTHDWQAQMVNSGLRQILFLIDPVLSA